MSPTVSHVRDTRNAIHGRKSVSGTREQVTRAPEQDGVIGSYSLDPGYTIAGVVVAIAGAFFAMGCIIGVGICKTLGAK